MASATKKVSLLPSEVAASLSPSMQREMSEIVYGRRKSRRPPAHRGQYRSTNPKLRHESTKLHYILSGGEESVYQFAGKDNEDHFASAGGMLLRDDADDGNAFDAVYDEKFVHKDTESHFKDFGMTLVDDSDRGNAFDRVYNTAHEHKDTEDHFQSLGGMVLGDDADGTAEAEAPRSPGELGTTFAAIPRADSPRTEAPLLGSLQASRATATAGGGASTARHGRSPLW